MAEKVTLESLGTKIDEIGVALESLVAMTARGFAESRKETFEEFDKVRKEMQRMQEEMDRGFASIDKRLEEHYQSQLNTHAIRIKNLEAFTGMEVNK